MSRGNFNFKELKTYFQTHLFDEYGVALHFKDIAGGIPADPALVVKWINTMCKAKSDADREAIVKSTIEDLDEKTDEKALANWVVFKKDAATGRYYLEGRCIKSALKEAANIVKDIVGVRNFKSVMADRVFVKEEKIFFKVNGEFVTGELEFVERPVQVMTRQGHRSSVKRTDIIRNCTLEFTLQRIATFEVPEKALACVLTYLVELGCGSYRAQGHGKMNDVECVRTFTVEKETEKPEKKQKAA